MKRVPVKCDTVDMQTGEVVDTREVPFSIQPPPATACQVCGRNPAHEPDQPHDAHHLYYQFAFYADHGRWPTWRDAVAHCADDVKEQWELALRRRGMWPADEVAP